MFCTNCGAGNQTAAFCTGCGARLETKQVTPEPVAPSQPAPVAPTAQPAATSPTWQTPQSAPTNLASPGLANPYIPSSNQTPKKKKFNPLFAVLPVVAIAVVGAIVLLTANQQAGPLTQAQAQKFIGAIEVSSQINGFERKDADDPSDLSSPYYESSFEDQSDQCQAIADLERLTRYAGRGQAGVNVIPPLLTGFDAWAGQQRTLSTNANSDYDYITFDYAVISFEEKVEAAAYIEQLESAAALCTTFNDIDLEGLSNFYEQTQSGPVAGFDSSLRIEYIGTVAITFRDEPIIVSFAKEFSIVQFGHNVVITYSSSSDGASSRLGLSLSDTRAESNALFAQAEEKLNEAARN